MSGASGRDVTLNAGLRYDLQKFAKPEIRNPDAQLAAAGIDTSVLPTDGNNWAPRLGVAWSPAGQQVRRPRRLRAVLRAHAVDHGRHGALQQRHQRPDDHVHRQPDARSTRPSSRRCRPAWRCPGPPIFTFSSEYANARIQQASAGFEWEVMRDTSLGVCVPARRRTRSATVDRFECRRLLDRRPTPSQEPRRRSPTIASAPVHSPTSRASSRSRARPSPNTTA